MKTSLLASAIAVTLSTSAVFAADLKFAPGEDARFNWQSYEALKNMDLKGETVTIFGPWLTEDKELVESVIAYFEAATGAKVNYSGSDSFEQQIAIDVQAGSAPNIAIFPQPGLAADLASKGFLTPLDPKMGEWINDNYAAGSSWSIWARLQIKTVKITCMDFSIRSI
ncbi:extracellular solute-binding protein [Vibrio variabilis]|uniref:extracellular solute-binding protein n=1 Tax=Vibrio variabilis TaxID=990271 RepID=UPI001EFA2233|nr:extracellular solute-binding protein [Vibrio variabilis]